MASKRRPQQTRLRQPAPAVDAPDLGPLLAAAPVEPRAVRALDPDARRVLDTLIRSTAEIRRLEEDRDQVVARLRAAGAAWSAVGWAVGTTGEAARQRWGR